MTVLTPASVFRKYETDGVPSSGAHDPKKDEIVQLLEQMGDAGGAKYSVATKAELDAITPAANEQPRGEVLGDATASNNGWYVWDSGASVWVFERGFPDTFARVTLSGTGTAQTGVVGTGVNPADIEVFFAVVTTANTGPLTLSIGGETARDVVNLAGNALSAGEWTGVVMFFLNDDGDYQLLIDAGAAAAAAQSATHAQTAQAGAEQALADFNEKYLGAFADDAAATAAAGGAPITGAEYWNTTTGKRRTWDGAAWQDTSTSLDDGAVTEPKLAASLKAKIMGIAADRTVLAGLDGTAYQAVDLMEAGRKGLFYWDGSDLSAKVTADPDQGIYVPPTSDSTGASGAWVRQFDGDLWLNWFGFSEAETALNNVLIFNRVILFSQTPRRTIVIPAGEFDISVIGSASANNGIKLVSDTAIRGQGPRKSVLNLVGASTATNLNNFTGGSGIGRIYTPGVANNGLSNVLLEDFAVTMNHPGDSVAPSVCQQIGIDFRHISRSTIRRCYLGNYSPISGNKGITNEFLAQGYAIAIGGSSGAAVDYAHQELNIIEENTIVGAKYGVAMEIVGPYTGAAYQTTIRRNDIQMCQRLIVQGGSGGAGNVIAGNTLQNLVKPNGDASITIGIWINGHGNRVEMDYGEFGTDCQHMIRLEAASARNWVSVGETNSAAGGVVDGIQDSGTNNVIWFFANTGGAGTWTSSGAPTRRVNKTNTVMT